MFVNDVHRNVDVIAISETWIQNSINEFALDGYKLFHTPRNNKRGGGVAIYIKELLCARVLINSSFSLENCCECITIELSLEKAQKALITCIYRTPTGDHNLFLNKLEEVLDLSNNRRMFLCGDFNIDLMKFESNNVVKNFVSLLSRLGFYSLITKPSRISRSSASLIDNIFTNILDRNMISGIVINDISDHMPVYTLCGLRGQKTDCNKLTYERMINPKSVKALLDELTNQSWQSVYSTNDVNEAYENFLCHFLDLLNKFCPLKLRKIRSRRNYVWMTSGLLNACKKKNMLYKDFLKLRTKEAENKYKTYKNRLTKIMRQCKKKYYNDLLVTNKNDIRETWKILNHISKRKPQNHSIRIPDKMKTSTSEFNNRKSIAEGFNNFFVNIGPDLASEIDTPLNSNIHKYMKDPTVNSMFVAPATEKEIIGLVRDFKNKTSVDVHNISMSLVKQVVT